MPPSRLIKDYILTLFYISHVYMYLVVTAVVSEFAPDSHAAINFARVHYWRHNISNKFELKLLHLQLCDLE